MPDLDAPPRPPKNVSGTDITRAQGHDTTRKVRARSSHTGKAAVHEAQNSGGTKATSRAATTTMGV